MNYRIFCGEVDLCHRRWFADQFSLDFNSHRGGIDVHVNRDDINVGFEIKSRWARWPPRFTIDATQKTRYRQEDPDRELYWIFLRYTMNTTPEQLKLFNDDHIVERVLYVLPWTYVDQFSIATPSTGPYIYVPQSQWPPKGEFETVTLDHAVMHQPVGSDLANRLFPF